MSEPPVASSAAGLSGRLKRRALTLGTAGAFDYAMQFMLPVILVRTLAPPDFGHYRLLWLALSTVLALAPLGMTQSLYYFLPRATPAGRRLHVHHTLLYMVAAGAVGAWAISPWNPLQPPAVAALNAYAPLVPLLAMCWVTASLLDVLPTVDERTRWQAGVTMGISLTRAIALGLAAWLTGDLRIVFLAILVLGLVKLFVLLRYIGRLHGLGGPWLRRAEFAEQFRHALPFGLSSSLFSLRAQSDQWVAASLFAVHEFAAFSIAIVIGPMINLFRTSVNYAFLPSMSRLQSTGDIAGMLDLNSRGNVLVARLVYPVLAFVFVFAEDIIGLIYTPDYLAAANVMRIYIACLVGLVVELFSLTLLLKEGQFALRLNIAVLAASVAMSWSGAVLLGLPGAALGSVLALYIDRLATLARIGQRLGLPLRRLQDWATLGRLLAAAAVAALAAWAVTAHWLATAPVLLRLPAGAAVLGLVYLAGHALEGVRWQKVFAAYGEKG